jgi:hypothetical protein
MQQRGGRIGHLADDATPFENRATQFVYMVMSGWEHRQDRTRHVAWARQTWECCARRRARPRAGRGASELDRRHDVVDARAARDE